MLRHYLTLPRDVYILCLGTLVSRLGMMFVPFLAIYLGKHLGHSEQFATVAMGCLGAGAIGGALLGGQLADQLGRRGVMIAALFGSGLVILGYPFLRAEPLLLLGAALYTFIGDMYRPAASALIADLVEPEKRPYAFGLMYMSINLGFGAGPLIGGILARISYDLIFLANFAALAIFALIVLFAVHEPRKSRSAAHVGDAGQNVGFAAAMAHILRDTRFMIFLAATFFISLVYMQSMSTFPLYLDQRGFAEDSYGSIIAVNGLMIAACQVFIASAIARLPRGWVLVAGGITTSIGFALIGVAQNEWAYRGTVVIWTLGEMMQAPLLAPIVAEIAPTALRARYMSMVNIAFSGANAIGAPLGGLLLLVISGGSVWLVIAASSLLGALLYGVIAPGLSRPITAVPIAPVESSSTIPSGPGEHERV